MKRNLCIFKGISLAMNEKKEKRFEKKKNFKRLWNNHVLNGVLENSFDFLLSWEVTIKSANLAKNLLETNIFKAKDVNITIVCFLFSFFNKKINKFSYLYFLPF